jgi:hypothetical protein
MNQIELLKQKVERAKAERAKKITETAEIARLKATLKLESSEVLFQSKVKLEMATQQTSKLQQLVDECAAIVASMPIHNSKTRSNRVWSGNQRYGFGTQVNLMYQLATGILYSCQEHKQLLLAHTGLNAELLEQLVKAFGTPTYYSRNNHVIVEAKPYNIEMVKATIDVLQSELGVVIDTSELVEKAFKDDFSNAVERARGQLLAAEEAIQEADLEL